VKSNLEKRFGIIDKSPVPREFFKQWVIEDKFVAGRPAWEKVGAQMVKDVHPYEIAKIRMLNVVRLASLSSQPSPETACHAAMSFLLHLMAHT
jgi:mannitol-1-phosphate/altronate dehydrogenase